MENGRRYDIVRAESEKSIIWLEGATNFDLARARVKQLISFWPGKYQIFDLQTKEIVLDTASALGNLPESNPTEVSRHVSAPEAPQPVSQL
jgi:hypothetical protein